MHEFFNKNPQCPKNQPHNSYAKYKNTWAVLHGTNSPSWSKRRNAFKNKRGKCKDRYHRYHGDKNKFIFRRKHRFFAREYIQKLENIETIPHRKKYYSSQS